MTEPRAELTAVLNRVGQGDESARTELFERVYDELRRTARNLLRSESREPTLIQTTDLVNEAYLKLVKKADASWENRRHFFGAASRAMRQILIEYARKKQTQRRGEGAARITLSEGAASTEPVFEILALHQALDRLELRDPRAARIVEYRYFLGLTVQETADALEISKRTVDKDTSAANAWLRREIDQAAAGS